MASYLFFKIKKKIRERKRYDPWKNSKKKQKNAIKKTLLFSAATWIAFFMGENVEI